MNNASMGKYGITAEINWLKRKRYDGNLLQNAQNLCQTEKFIELCASHAILVPATSQVNSCMYE